MTQDEYIDERLTGQSDWFRRRSAENKRRHYFSQGSIIVISALIPFVAGMELGLEDSFKNALIGMMGVSIAIVSGLAGLYKFQDKWTEYRTTRERLLREEYNFRTHTGPYGRIDEPFPMFVERIEEILTKERDRWNQYIITQENQ